MNEWLLLLIFVGIALLACCIGFKKFVWFISIGYGFAVAALGISYIVYAIINHNLDFICILQGLVFVAYGSRLSGFLLARELKNVSYHKVLESVTKTKGDKPMPIFVLITMWIMVGILYVGQTSPMFYRIYNGLTITSIGSFTFTNGWLPLIGIVISVIALILESVADKQKTLQKITNPKMVATKGLYKHLRCPNYFAEILFWTGVLVGGLTSLASWYQWVIAIISWICIIYIMINGAQRLDKRQERNYGTLQEYRDYADHTPLIFPFIPVSHIGIYKAEDIEAAAKMKVEKKDNK